MMSAEGAALQEQLRARLPRLQALLRLQDWRVALHVRRLDDFPDTMQGCCWTTSTKQQATIWVLDPVDYHAGSPDFPPDPLQTLVHELIHLHFDPFMNGERGTAEHTTQEQAIDALAWTITELLRRAEPGPAA
jgi:hypothetical protein